MSVLTFARRDECWKKGKNPFKKERIKCYHRFNLICPNCGNEETIEVLDTFKKKLNGGLKNGNRK